jgi:hypothetical protein
LNLLNKHQIITFQSFYVNMDNVSRLINLFKSEDTFSLANIDSSGKPEIVTELEGIDDERILPFFLEVLLNELEYDLARIETLQVLKLRNCSHQEEYDQIGQAIKQVLVNSTDQDIRNYAAMAIASYIETEGAFDVIEGILLDEKEDINLRYNAFGVIEEIGLQDRSMEILKKLIQNPEFNQPSLRLLNEWQVNI